MKEAAKDQDKFVLRMPDGLRDRLKAVAEENNRSMNAEIVDRIEKSFLVDTLTTKNAELEGRASTLEMMLSESQTRAAEFHKRADEGSHTLYVLLDADGFPVSWQEVMLHLSEIQKASGMDIDSIDARVLAPEKVSNYSSNDRWREIAAKYMTHSNRSEEKPNNLVGGRAVDLGTKEKK
jgi:hypothetical protein